MSREPEKAT